MLDISFMELIVIGVVALVVVAPKDLPRVLRTVGGYLGKMRRMAADFQRQLNDAVRDEELDQLRKQVTEIGRSTEADMRRGLTLAPDNHVPTRRSIAVGDAHKTAASARGPAMTPLAPPLPAPAVSPPAESRQGEADAAVGGVKP